MKEQADLSPQSSESPTSCSKCGSPELDGTGACRACGSVNRLTPAASSEKTDQPVHTGLIEMETLGPNGVAETDPQELPQWRLELSRRLQEIKQKRGSVSLLESEPAETPPPLIDHQEEGSVPPRKMAPGRAPRAAIPRAGIVPDAEPAAPQPPPPQAEAPAPAQLRATDEKGETAPAVSPSKPQQVGDRTVDDIRALIDRMVQDKSPEPAPAGPVAESFEEPPFRELIARAEPEVDKLILLSRTFSGLVDAIIVVLLAAATVFAVDIIEGIEILDAVSLLYYAGLLAATFLVYSVFFLATANQTIGMMITDLRIVTRASSRPGLGRIFIRSFAYLLSLAPAGLGLLWGFFDRQACCMHDRLSQTQVIRVYPY